MLFGKKSILQLYKTIGQATIHTYIGVLFVKKIKYSHLGDVYGGW